MPISINDAVSATNIFLILFLAALLLTIRKRTGQGFFPHALTTELKGLAILAVVFSHIGYFLVIDHRFLFPLSIMAGVGVNLFLFLSGYGLAASASMNQLSVPGFYRRRLLKILIPFWLTVALFFILDFFLLGRVYPLSYITESLLGFFPQADLVSDLNSPLWYFTLILFYYLLFPLLFSRKWTWISAIAIYFASVIGLDLVQEELAQVLTLYDVHLVAFPLGILFLGLQKKLGPHLLRLDHRRWLAGLGSHKVIYLLKQSVYYLGILFLMYLIGYTAYHSGVGKDPDQEQAISLITMSAIMILFMLQKYEIGFFYLFGFFSYEVYLLHWPLLRYFKLFGHMPSWLAMVLYLAICLASSYALRWVAGALTDLLGRMYCRIRREKAS